MVMESKEPEDEKVYSFTMAFRIFDQDAFELALEDLQYGGVWDKGEGPADNTTVQNLEILVEHLDVIASYRGNETTAYTDIGIERVSQ